MSEIYCSECNDLFDIEDAVCSECATVRWLEVDDVLERYQQDRLIVGLFAVTPNFLIEEIVICKQKDGYWYDQNGSLLPPTYKKLLKWYPCPQPRPDPPAQEKDNS